MGFCLLRQPSPKQMADGHLQEWRRHVAKDRPDSQLIAAQDFVGINHLVVLGQHHQEDMSEVS